MVRISASSFATTALAAFALFAMPAMAQAGSERQVAEEKINQLFVFGDDECPQSEGDEIVVCARLDEEERYRIPQDLRGNEDVPSRQSWARRVRAYEYVGADGIQSCSPTGGGGFTGCGLNAIDQAYAEKRQDPGKTFGLLIAQKRAERLAQIDAEAEEVEKRVQKFEEERAAREALQEAARREAAGLDTNPDAEPLPQPQ